MFYNIALKKKGGVLMGDSMDTKNTKTFDWLEVLLHFWLFAWTLKVAEVMPKILGFGAKYCTFYSNDYNKKQSINK